MKDQFQTNVSGVKVISTDDASGYVSAGTNPQLGHPHPLEPAQLTAKKAMRNMAMIFCMIRSLIWL